MLFIHSETTRKIPTPGAFSLGGLPHPRTRRVPPGGAFRPQRLGAVAQDLGRIASKGLTDAADSGPASPLAIRRLFFVIFFPSMFFPPRSFWLCFFFFLLFRFPCVAVLPFCRFFFSWVLPEKEVGHESQPTKRGVPGCPGKKRERDTRVYIDRRVFSWRAPTFLGLVLKGTNRKPRVFSFFSFLFFFGGGRGWHSHTVYWTRGLADSGSRRHIPHAFFCRGDRNYLNCLVSV